MAHAMKRSVEKEAFRRLILDEHAASELSIRPLCRREDVSEASFYFWRKELAARDQRSSQPASSPAIVPVRGVESKPARHANTEQVRTDPAGVIEIVTPGGVTLKANASTD
jgi:transposase-like protein